MPQVGLGAAVGVLLVALVASFFLFDGGPPLDSGADAETEAVGANADAGVQVPEAPDLSGEWELVSLSANGEPLSLDGYLSGLPWVEIVGSTVNGYDGCNSRDGGEIDARADGSLLVHSLGGGTLQECGNSIELEVAYETARSGGTWAFMPNGNLLLAGGGAEAEFRRIGDTTSSDE